MSPAIRPPAVQATNCKPILCPSREAEFTHHLFHS